MKQCPMCKEYKKLNEFSIKKGTTLYHSYCKKCATNRTKDYYKKNRTKVLKRVENFYKENKFSKREKYKAWSWKIKIETIDYYGGKCVCCGEDEPKFLALDHKDNDGNKHRKSIGNVKIYTWLKKNNYPTNFQILCHNCNMAKAFWEICPHQDKKLK